MGLPRLEGKFLYQDKSNRPIKKSGKETMDGDVEGIAPPEPPFSPSLFKCQEKAAKEIIGFQRTKVPDGACIRQYNVFIRIILFSEGEAKRFENCVVLSFWLRICLVEKRWELRIPPTQKLEGHRSFSPAAVWGNWPLKSTVTCGFRILEGARHGLDPEKKLYDLQYKLEVTHLHCFVA